VSLTSEVGPHFSNRRKAYHWPTVNDADYLVLGVRHFKKEDDKKLKRLKDRKQFRLVDEAEGIALYERIEDVDVDAEDDDDKTKRKPTTKPRTPAVGKAPPASGAVTPGAGTADPTAPASTPPTKSTSSTARVPSGGAAPAKATPTKAPAKAPAKAPTKAQTPTTGTPSPAPAEG